VIRDPAAHGRRHRSRPERRFGAEPVADIRVRGRRLAGIAIDKALVTAAIDEFRRFHRRRLRARRHEIRGAEELRVKESDRIQAMCEGCGNSASPPSRGRNGARIFGGRLPRGFVDSHGDHRVAMAFAMAGLKAEQRVTILDCANVNTSFPGFATLAAEAGLKSR